MATQGGGEFNVYLGGKKIDTVFATPGAYTADEMRRSLINHDGYDGSIRVTQARRKAARGQRTEPILAERNSEGAWVLSSLAGGHLVTRRYYGYTKRDAMIEFRAVLRAENRGSARGQTVRRATTRRTARSTSKVATKRVVHARAMVRQASKKVTAAKKTLTKKRQALKRATSASSKSTTTRKRTAARKR